MLGMGGNLEILQQCRLYQGNMSKILVWRPVQQNSNCFRRSQSCRRCLWCFSSPRRRAWRPFMLNTVTRYKSNFEDLKGFYDFNKKLWLQYIDGDTFQLAWDKWKHSIFPTGFPRGGPHSCPNVSDINIWGLDHLEDASHYAISRSSQFTLILSICHICECKFQWSWSIPSAHICS